MKLRHLATFLCRFVGAWLVVLSLLSVVLLVPSARTGDAAAKAFLIATIPGLLGGNSIYFSKDLAAIFCKGLDDDSP